MTDANLGATNFDELDVQGQFKLDIEPAGFKPVVRALGGTIRDRAWVPYAQLRVRPGYNNRLKGAVYRRELATLVQMLVEHGYKEDIPMTGITAMENGEPVIYILRGHRRHEAIPLANIERVKQGKAPIDHVTLLAKTWTDQDEKDDPEATLDLITSNTGSPLGMYESGLTYKRARAEGKLSNVQMARMTGVSEGHVRNCLKLLEAPRELVDMIADGKITETQALKLIREHGGEANAGGTAADAESAAAADSSTPAAVAGASDEAAAPDAVAADSQVAENPAAENVMAHVRKAVAQANSLGKARVTSVATHGFKLPPKVGQSAVQAIGNLMKSLDKSVVKRLAKLKEGEELGANEADVSVPLSVLRELMSVSNQIADARSAVDAKYARALQRGRDNARAALSDLDSAAQKRVYDTLQEHSESSPEEMKASLIEHASLTEDQADAVLVLRDQAGEGGDIFAAPEAAA